MTTSFEGRCGVAVNCNMRVIVSGVAFGDNLAECHSDAVTREINVVLAQERLHCVCDKPHQRLFTDSKQCLVTGLQRGAEINTCHYVNLLIFD